MNNLYYLICLYLYMVKILFENILIETQYIVTDFQSTNKTV